MPRIPPNIFPPSFTVPKPKVTGQIVLFENPSPGETLTFSYGRHKLVLTAANPSKNVPLSSKEFPIGMNASQTVVNITTKLNQLHSATDLSPQEWAVVRRIPKAFSIGNAVQIPDISITRTGRRLDVVVPQSTAIDEARESFVIFA